MIAAASALHDRLSQQPNDHSAQPPLANPSDQDVREPCEPAADWARIVITCESSSCDLDDDPRRTPSENHSGAEPTVECIWPAFVTGKLGYAPV